MSFNNGPTVITNGLVLALDAGDRNSYNSGSTTWFDLTGTNNGTLTNGPTFNSGSGGSIVFDGVDDYVVSNVSVLPVMTFSAWVKINNILSNTYIFNKTPTTGNNNNYAIYIGSGLTLNIISYDGSTVSQFASNYIPSTNVWFNIAGVYNSTLSSIYINGLLDKTGTINTVNSGTQVSIGYNLAGIAGAINANISSVQIYNRALSAQEVLQNYNATKGRFGL